MAFLQSRSLSLVSSSDFSYTKLFIASCLKELSRVTAVGPTTANTAETWLHPFRKVLVMDLHHSHHSRGPWSARWQRWNPLLERMLPELM